MEEDSDLKYEAKELPKFTRLLLFVGLALALYNCIAITTLSLVLDDVGDFFRSDGANKNLLVFFISDAIILLISWGSAIVQHKNDNGEIVELTKEKSKNFAKFVYYMSVVMLLVVVISIVFAIFGW
jgi:hypothetical protein